MSKIKEVLVVEYQDVFDKVAVRITYQDESILKRVEFRDPELKVYSFDHPDYYIDPGSDGGSLYIRGSATSSDSRIMLVRKKDAEVIKQKVAAINQKYGVKQRWRAEVGEDYFYIKGSLERFTYRRHTEEGMIIDDQRHAAGNYFESPEQVKEAFKRMSETLMKYHEEIINQEDK